MTFMIAVLQVVNSSDKNGGKVLGRAKCSLSFAARKSHGNLSQQVINHSNKHKQGKVLHIEKYSRGFLSIVKFKY